MEHTYEKMYLYSLEAILNRGQTVMDRTGTGTISDFGHQLSADLTQGFPLLTTKKVFWKGVVEELLWMLSGSTNVKPLQERGVTIWDEWSNSDGELGPVYGKQWRSWFAGEDLAKEQPIFIDQIKNLVDGLRNNPTSRRHIVSAWNVSDIDSMKLPPCHCFFQCYVRGEYLDLQLYQRSADMFLGVPFNVASYALLNHLIANCVGLKPGRFFHTFGDCHIYSNHLDAVKTQLAREPMPMPQIKIHTRYEYPWEYHAEDIELIGYKSHGKIAAEVSV